MNQYRRKLHAFTLNSCTALKNRVCLQLLSFLAAEQLKLSRFFKLYNNLYVLIYYTQKPEIKKYVNISYSFKYKENDPVKLSNLQKWTTLSH